MSDTDFESKMKYKISGIEKRREQREENINKVFFSFSKTIFLIKIYIFSLNSPLSF